MRYLILMLLVAPIMFISLLDTITQYKLSVIDRRQLANKVGKTTILWMIVFFSFPVYNLLNGQAIFESSTLTAIDIAEIVAIVYLLYITGRQRVGIDTLKKKLYELHTNLSILISKSPDKNKT